MSVNHLSWGQTWEALRSWWIDPQTLVDHGLKIRELLRGLCVNLRFRCVQSADLRAKLGVGFVRGIFEQVIRCRRKERGNGLAARDANFN